MHGEVRGGAEPLSAVVAGEQFLAGVLARVDAELGPGRTALQADRTHELLVPSMCEHVVVPGGRGGEPGGADLAAVRLLPRVGPAVVDQCRLLRETTVAELTLVWPLSSMDPHVCVELGYFIEALVAYIAHMVPYAAVLLHVLAQRRVTTERLVALVALQGLLARVQTKMNFQVSRVVEALVASSTDVGPLAPMARHVRAQRVPAVEALVTHGTQVSLLFEVSLSVAVQQRLAREDPLTDGTSRLLRGTLFVRTHVHFQHTWTLKNPITDRAQVWLLAVSFDPVCVRAHVLLEPPRMLELFVA